MFRDSGRSSQEVLFNSSKSLDECEAGKIMTVRLGIGNLPNRRALPESLLKLVGPGVSNSERVRRGLVEKLMKNSPNDLPIIGKPSSCFVVRNRSGAFYVDYLAEDPAFKRNPNRTLHSYMVEKDNTSHRDRYHPNQLFIRDSLWSGHVANLTPDYLEADYCYLLLLDRFDRASNVATMGNTDRFAIRVLHANRILPLTGDGKLIFENN